MTKEAQVIAPTKTVLSQLYVTGEEVDFDNGETKATVWVQKLNPGETQLALEASRPAKYKISSIKRLSEDDPIKLRYLDELETSGYETERKLIEFIIQEKVTEAIYSARERVAAEDEWAKEGYLDGLQDAWNDELYEKWLENEKDEDAARVYKELKRYTDKVNEEAEGEKNELIFELQDYSLEALQKKAVAKLIESHSDNALLNEFRKNQLFYAVREHSDHSKRVFDDPSEIETLPGPITNKLMMKFQEINVDSFEGKD